MNNALLLEVERIVTVMLAIDMMASDSLKNIDRILAKGNLKSRQYSILCQITRTDIPLPRSQKELARRSAIRENRIVSILHRMSQSGLLRREKTKDRRLNLVTITDKGRKKLDRAQGEVKRYSQDLFSKLGQEEKQALMCLLKAYH